MTTVRAVRRAVPLDGPALVALLAVLAGLSIYTRWVQAITPPRIGVTVSEHPGLLLGTLLLGLLLLALWGRDWTSTPLRAVGAPLLGAVVSLAIMSAPVMLVTRMDFDRPGGKMQLQNVVLFPGAARPGGRMVVSNASVKAAPGQQSRAGNMLKGEGWMSIQIDQNRPYFPLWLVLPVAPLLGLGFHLRRRRTATSLT